MNVPRGAQIKGSSILSKMLYLHETFGEEAEARLSSFLAERGLRQVLAGSWYSFELFDQVLRYIADQWLGGDLRRLREVGAFSAEKALTTTYEVYALGDFTYFLDRISGLHGRFYSEGSLTVLREEGESRCRLRLHGASFYSEPDLEVAAGFYSGAARFLGAQEVQCRFEVAEDEVVFYLSWRE